VAVKQVLHLFGCLRGCAAARGLGHFFSGTQGSRNVENSAASVEAAWNKRVEDKHTTRLYFYILPAEPAAELSE